MELIGHSPDYTNLFGDKRLEKRGKLISQILVSGRKSSVHAITSTQSEQKGFYRFLDNNKVKESDLIKELTTRCGKNVSERDIVVIQDSTSIGLSKQAGHMETDSGLGLVGNKTGLGFLAHVSLVLDSHTESMLGFSDVQLWHRTEDKSNNTTKVYKKQPIEEKESYKWIRASQQAKEGLNAAKSITIIEDREGDIYEQFSLIPDEKTNLIIRNRDNRKLSDGLKLYQVLEQAPVLGTVSLKVYGEVRKNKIKREAIVEVRCQQVTIQKPTNCKNTKVDAALPVYVVEAKEQNAGFKDAICWRLMTSKKVETFEEALAIIDTYKLRWYIEQLFRLLKKQGYQIEETELESGWAIRKMFVLVLNAALRVMQLYLAYEEENSQDIEEVFSKDEIECLHAINTNHIVKTEKTHNPYNAQKLSWASWIIARLGGWKGNTRQRKPGPIIMKKGIDVFDIMFQGWKLAQIKT